jgi:hypothetical protein
MVKYTIEKEFRHHVVEWSATFLSLVGAILNANKLISCFYVWSLANILWMGFAIKHRHWGLLIMNLVFLGINIFAIFKWKTSFVIYGG